MGWDGCGATTEAVLALVDPVAGAITEVAVAVWGWRRRSADGRGAALEVVVGRGGVGDGGSFIGVLADNFGFAPNLAAGRSATVRSAAAGFGPVDAVF